METRAVLVDGIHPQTGKPIKRITMLIVCDKCSNDSFRVIIVNGHHHLQCMVCRTSYCGGHSQCSAVPHA
jgi:hypothetical protein